MFIYIYTPTDTLAPTNICSIALREIEDILSHTTSPETYSYFSFRFF